MILKQYFTVAFELTSQDVNPPAFKKVVLNTQLLKTVVIGRGIRTSLVTVGIIYSKDLGLQQY